MPKDGLQYETMMESALRGVMHQALVYAAERGLPGNHHFYITFRTEHPGVEIPATLRQKYPREMTIVLQYQYWRLGVTDEGFEVTLSFDSKQERLVIPFAAVTAFVDPSVQFGLQFPSAAAAGAIPSDATSSAPTTVRVDDSEPAKPAADGERVVKLDSFRKK